MIVTFKSRSAASVIMFGDVAKQLLQIMGKGTDVPGIITLEQLPAALQALREAAERDRPAARAARAAEEAAWEADPLSPPPGQNIALSQRAVPLIELLECALAGGDPVVWA